MAGTFHDHFSPVAGAYRSFRPRYPPGLFAWLASIAPRRDAALDCGCGSGQASVGLAAHFARVHAVDPSPDLVAHAEPHPGVDYRVARAEETGLPPASVDLVVAAQAFHWFDQPAFEREVRRVARPGAAVAAITYGRSTVSPEVDAVVDRLYGEIVGADWPPERVHVESGYRTLPFPWPEVEAPAFDISESWDLGRLLGYLATWSAVTRHRKRTGGDPVALVEPALREAWGPPAAQRRVTWPLSIRAGRVS
jgi:SAM-dependent methyltransferase